MSVTCRNKFNQTTQSNFNFGTIYHDDPLISGNRTKENWPVQPMGYAYKSYEFKK